MLSASIELSKPGMGFDQIIQGQSLIDHENGNGTARFGDFNRGTVEVLYRFDIAKLGAVSSIEIEIHATEFNAFGGGSDIQVGQTTRTITSTDSSPVVIQSGTSSQTIGNWIDGESDSEMSTDYVDIRVTNSGFDDLLLERIDVTVNYENVDQFHLETFHALHSGYERLEHFDDTSGDYLRDFGFNAANQALLQESLFWLENSATALIAAGGWDLFAVVIPPGYLSIHAAASTAYTSLSETYSLLDWGAQIQDANNYSSFPTPTGADAQSEINAIISSSESVPSQIKSLADSWHAKVQGGLSDSEKTAFQSEISSDINLLQLFTTRLNNYVSKVNDYTQAPDVVRGRLFQLVASMGGFVWNSGLGTAVPSGNTLPTAYKELLEDISEKIDVDNPDLPDPPTPGDETVYANTSAYIGDDNSKSQGLEIIWAGIGNSIHRRAYLKFDTGDVPLGSTIEDATLSIYARTFQTHDVLAPFELDSSWSYSSISWNNQPNPVSFNDNTQMAPGVSLQSPGWIEFDLTDWMQDVVDLEKDNDGVMFDGFGTMSMWSRNSSNRPVLAINYTTPTGLPDLTSREVTANGQSNITADPDQQLTVNFEILNKGEIPAERADYQVVWSDNDVFGSSDTPLFTDNSRALAVDEDDNESGTVTIPTNVLPGEVYYIGVIADYDNQINESNETNNAGLSYITVTIADNTAPTGALSIADAIDSDGDANTLDTPIVAVSPTATDDSGTVTEMQFSYDGLNWEPWTNYTSNSFSLTVPQSEIDTSAGQISLFARYRDAAGNVSPSYSDSLGLRPTSADFNGDGEITGADFLIWQRGFGTVGTNASRDSGNTDVDLSIDGEDLAVWISQYEANINPPVGTNQQIVRWHGDYYKYLWQTGIPGGAPQEVRENRWLRGTTAVGSQNHSLDLDLDNDGQMDDSRAYFDFSLTEPLNPPDTGNPGQHVYHTDLPSARFYGGLSAEFLNYETDRVQAAFIENDGAGGELDDVGYPSPYLTPEHQSLSDFIEFARHDDGRPRKNHVGPHEDFAINIYRADLTHPVNAGDDSSDNELTFAAAFIWKKEDFLAGGDAATVSLNSESYFSFQSTRWWENVGEVRWILQDENDQLYISQFSVPGSRDIYGATNEFLDPLSSNWAEYHPGVYQLNFDQTTAAWIDPVAFGLFSDIQAVGLYIENDVPSGVDTKFTLDEIQFHAVVTPTAAAATAAEESDFAVQASENNSSLTGIAAEFETEGDSEVEFLHDPELQTVGAEKATSSGPTSLSAGPIFDDFESPFEELDSGEELVTELQDLDEVFGEWA